MRRRPRFQPGWYSAGVLLDSLLAGGMAGAQADESARIAVHLMPHTSKTVCPVGELPPCNADSSALIVQGSVGIPYDAYLLVLDGDPERGVGGASFGLSYDGAKGSGLDIFGWTRCATLEFPGGPGGIAWPDSGSGNLLTWDPINDCQRSPAPGDGSGGVSALLGILYIFAYGDDALSLTPRTYTALRDFSVSDCSAGEYTVEFPSGAGSAGFGTEVGRDPCSAPSDSVLVAGIDPEVPFEETLDKGTDHLWVAGREVTDPSITCRWDGRRFTINGTWIQLDERTEAQQAESLQLTIRVNGGVPSVAAALATRDTSRIEQAISTFWREKTTLYATAWSVAYEAGMPAAIALIRESPLVERVDALADGRSVNVWFVGLEHHVAWYDIGATPLPIQAVPSLGSMRVRAATDILEILRSALGRHEGREWLVYITADGSILEHGGPRVREIEGQFRRICEGESIETAVGPFKARDAPLREVQANSHS